MKHARLNVDLPARFTLDELISAVEDARGRRVRIREVPQMLSGGDGLCGLWLATDEVDLILHASSESPLHKQQFILHELAHILMRHDLVERERVGTTPLSGFPAAAHVLARRNFVDDIEKEAEAMADRLARRIRCARETRFEGVFG